MKHVKEAVKWTLTVCAILIIVVLVVQLLGQLLSISDKKSWDPLAFIGSVLGAAIGGVIAWYGVSKTISHTADMYIKQKREENQEANIRVRITYQTMVLNRLSQIHTVISDTMYGTGCDDLIGYLPNDFEVSMDVLIRNINYIQFPTESQLIFLKLRMLQSLYYINGIQKEDINGNDFNRRAKFVMDHAKELHDELEKKLEARTL